MELGGVFFFVDARAGGLQTCFGRSSPLEVGQGKHTKGWMEPVATAKPHRQISWPQHAGRCLVGCPGGGGTGVSQLVPYGVGNLGSSVITSLLLVGLSSTGLSFFSSGSAARDWVDTVHFAALPLWVWKPTTSDDGSTICRNARCHDGSLDSGQMDPLKKSAARR